MSIYEGTWGSGAPPEELIDFELCRQMHIGWSELQATPSYVKTVWWDLLNARAEAEAAAHDRSR